MNQSIKDIFKLIEDEPNNMELGKTLRQYYWDTKDKNTIEQFNRNRAPEDQVHTIQEMSDRVSELFSEPQYVYEKNPDTGQMYRREVGNYDEKQEVDSKLNPLPEQLELFKDASGC